MEEIKKQKGIVNFLKALHPVGFEGNLAIWTKQDRLTKIFKFNELNEAATYAIEQSKTKDVYYGVGIMGQRPTSKGRGTADNVSILPGFWLDVDVAGPNHAAVKLPTNKEDVQRLLACFPFKPTIVVETAGDTIATTLLKNRGN